MERSELKSVVVEVMNETYLRKDLFERFDEENKGEHTEIKRLLLSLIALIIGSGAINLIWG